LAGFRKQPSCEAPLFSNDAVKKAPQLAAMSALRGETFDERRRG
jgi:hypothetical protein